MNKLKPILLKFIYFFSAIIAGICLFGASTAQSVNSSILKPEFHKYLFEKNDIYSHAQSLIQSSMTDFMNNLKKYSPQDFQQHEDIFLILQKSITPEMMKTNLDSIRDGLFEYFNDTRQFLPDIYLNTQDVAANSKSINTESDKISYALTKIDRINLSLILQYINRNDITDKLSIIKLVFFLLDKLPVFSILIFFLLFLTAFAFSHKACILPKWTAVCLITCGIMELAAGISLIAYSYWLLPHNIYPLTSSIPLQPEVLTSYIRDCTNNLLKPLLIFGSLYFILSTTFFLLPKFLPFLSKNRIDGKKDIKKFISIIKYSTCAIIFLLIISVLIHKLYTFKKDFYANDFPVIVSKIKNTNTITQVISAKDTAIYTLLVKLVDKNTNSPVTDVEINVSGESSAQKKFFNQTFTTDELGESRYSLDKGTFRVSFNSSHFPINYQLPSPFYFDLKTAGTKIITVSLEESSEISTQNWGIAEIEVLDKDNNPVPDLDLSVVGIVTAPGLPNEVISVTNSEGIAVFKLNEGEFKIGFAEAKFPTEYQQPSPIDVTITSSTITRYTLRLAEKKTK